MTSVERLLWCAAASCAGVFLVLFAVERKQLLSGRPAPPPAALAAASGRGAPRLVAATAFVVAAEPTVATVKFDLLVIGLSPTRPVMLRIARSPRLLVARPRTGWAHVSGPGVHHWLAYAELAAGRWYWDWRFPACRAAACQSILQRLELRRRRPAHADAASEVGPAFWELRLSHRG